MSVTHFVTVGAGGSSEKNAENYLCFLLRQGLLRRLLANMFLQLGPTMELKSWDLRFVASHLALAVGFILASLSSAFKASELLPR